MNANEGYEIARLLECLRREAEDAVQLDTATPQRRREFYVRAESLCQRAQAAIPNTYAPLKAQQIAQRFYAWRKA